MLSPCFDSITSKPKAAARKTIVSLADLQGLCRPGKPGFVVVQGPLTSIHEMERDMRVQLSTCTCNMGCWGPANHHFQSISVVAQTTTTCSTTSTHSFVEVETETVLHLAHGIMQARGWLDLFWEGTRLHPGSYEVLPDNPGKSDPYLKPRGGTKRKKGNHKVR